MPTKKKTAAKASKKSTKAKAAPKKAAKKSTKKTTAKGRASKPKKAALVCAKGQKCFWTTDGSIISNLVELQQAFEKMADKVFKYHVSGDRNDFADWVESVLGDKELATALRKSRKPATARTVVVRRLKIYDV